MKPTVLFFADHIEHYQVAQKEASQAKVSNTKKRKVPNQLVPTDRSLVSDPEDSDDPAEEATPSPEHATSVLQGV